MVLAGRTGKVAFDKQGDRVYAQYELLNTRSGGCVVAVATHAYNAVRGLGKTL